MLISVVVILKKKKRAPPYNNSFDNESQTNSQPTQPPQQLAPTVYIPPGQSMQGQGMAFIDRGVIIGPLNSNEVERPSDARGEQTPRSPEIPFQPTPTSNAFRPERGPNIDEGPFADPGPSNTRNLNDSDYLGPFADPPTKSNTTRSLPEMGYGLETAEERRRIEDQQKTLAALDGQQAPQGGRAYF
jgi:hypothetical protein